MKHENNNRTEKPEQLCILWIDVIQVREVVLLILWLTSELQGIQGTALATGQTFIVRLQCLRTLCIFRCPDSLQNSECQDAKFHLAGMQPHFEQKLEIR